MIVVWLFISEQMRCLLAVRVLTTKNTKGVIEKEKRNLRFMQALKAEAFNTRQVLRSIENEGKLLNGGWGFCNEFMVNFCSGYVQELMLILCSTQ